MAQEVAIKLNFDAGNSVKEIERIDNVLKDIKKNTNVDNVNDQFAKLNATIDKGGNSAEDLQRAVKSYQTIALTAGRTSPIGQEALKRSAMLKDQMTDLDNEVKRLANDHKNLQGAMEIGSSVIGGYSAFQGVTAMLGTENEELMKTMVKLQGAQSALTGVMQLKTALEKESSAMMLVQNIRTKVATGLQLAYSTVIAGTTGALKLMRMALIATGLGAIVVLIGTLVANWDKWKDTIILSIEQGLKPLIDILRQLGIMESENAKILREATEQRIELLLREQDILKDRLDLVTSNYDNEIKLLKASGKETFDIEKEKLQAVYENTRQQALRLQELASLRTDLTEEEKQEQREKFKEFAILLKKQKTDIEAFEETHNTKMREKAKKHSEKLVSIKEKEEQEKLALKQRFEDLAIANIEDDAQRELMALDIKHQREMEKMIEQYGEKTELIAQLERVQETERLKAINDIQELQKEKDDSATEEKKKKESTYNQFVSDMFKKTSDEIALSTQQRDEAIAESKKALMSSTQNAIGMMINLAGEQSKFGKALAVTQAGIDTAMAISALVRYSQANPANAVTGGVAGAIQYASGALQIATSMKKVYSLLKSGSNVSVPSFSGGGSGGGSSTNTRTSQPTETNTNDVGRTEFVQNDNRVVLVESEVNAMRMRANQIDVISSI